MNNESHNRKNEHGVHSKFIGGRGVNFEEKNLFRRIQFANKLRNIFNPTPY